MPDVQLLLVTAPEVVEQLPAISQVCTLTADANVDAGALRRAVYVEATVPALVMVTETVFVRAPL